jgi:hypothetical protein
MKKLRTLFTTQELINFCFRRCLYWNLFRSNFEYIYFFANYYVPCPNHSLFNHPDHTWPIAVAARSKAWVCGFSLVGIVGSNPAEDMDVCLL